MAIGALKLAEDQYQNKIQAGHVDTSSYQNVTTAVQWDTTQDRFVRIKPTSFDSWIKITAASNTPAATEGMYIDDEYHTIIRAGEYIGASSEVNVVNMSEI